MLLLLCQSCGDVQTNTERAKHTGILHIGNGTEPVDLDPHIATGVPEHNIISALLEGLVAEHPKTLAPVPGIAKRWTISNDGKTYTFYFQDHARWSNGDPVTANDFVWSWQRLLSPAMGAAYAYQLYPLRNAKQFHSGEISDFSAVGVNAIDEKTLRVELEHATPYFISLLAHYSTFAVHPPTVLKFGAMTARGTAWTRAGNFVANGPFQLKRWRLNYLVEVEKNPYYWDSKTLKLNGIRFYPVTNAGTEERMFRTGALHLTASVPTDKISTYRENSAQLIHIAPYLGTYYYRFNANHPVLADQRVRRALSMTVDRQQIVEHVTKGGQRPAYVFTPPDTQGYFANSGALRYDIQTARQLLSEAGYPDGDGFPTLELLYNTSEGHRRIAEVVQQMWKKALNIDIELLNVDWKVYLSRSSSQNYDIARASWIGDYPDPNTFLDMFITDGSNNATGWSNQQYDTLIQRAAKTANQSQRFALFRQAEDILIAESPIIPIYTYTRVFLKSPDVEGWHSNVLDHHPYKHVSIKDGK
jgi:oligopeptide transport system substrate-binding protein